MENHILSNKEKQLLNSYREIQWVKRRIAQLEEEDKADKLDIPDTATAENIKESAILYKQHINEMRSELDMLTQYNKSKEAITTVIDEHHLAIKALYPEPTDHHHMELKKTTEEYINKRDDLVLEFFSVLKTLDEKKLEYTRLQRLVIQEHLRNKDTVQHIKALQVEQVDHQANSKRMKELNQT
jgi:hypothetical protein